jgi:xanthine dehydrogenase YagS FAD-binding subunit
MMKKFKHINATSIAEVESALIKGKTMLLAGGTDILNTLKEEILPGEMYPETIINLKTVIPSFDYIKEEADVLKIGALTRLEDIAKSTIVNQKWTALAQAAARTASPHIREMGTIGGNICQLNRCWYFRKTGNRFNCLRKDQGGLCYGMVGENRYHSIFGAVSGCVCVNPSDTAPALIALNAIVATTKRNIPIDEFFTTITAPKGVGSTVLEMGKIVTENQIRSVFCVKTAFVSLPLKSIDFQCNCAALLEEARRGFA